LLSLSLSLSLSLPLQCFLVEAPSQDAGVARPKLLSIAEVVLPMAVVVPRSWARTSLLSVAATVQVLLLNRADAVLVEAPVAVAVAVVLVFARPDLSAVVTAVRVPFLLVCLAVSLERRPILNLSSFLLSSRPPLRRIHPRTRSHHFPTPYSQEQLWKMMVQRRTWNSPPTLM
jgi:hypothetical protein